MVLSRYKQCQDCKYKFAVSLMVFNYEKKNVDLPLICPRCNKENIANIDFKTYIDR